MTVVGSNTNISDPELDAFAMKIRILMRDKAENNILLDNVQFTREEILCAIELAVSSYNTMTPATVVDFTGVPDDILFHWAAYYLTLSESFLQVRNQVSVPTDNLGVIGLDDKFGLYNALGRELKSYAEAKARAYKNQLNAEAAYGCVPSGYANVTRFNQG